MNEVARRNATFKQKLKQGLIPVVMIDGRPTVHGFTVCQYCHPDGREEMCPTCMIGQAVEWEREKRRNRR